MSAAGPRVRFAPSPTGYLHVGGARTALFNWLYARRHGGTFVLRIEDTDVERSSADMVTGILDGLRWLGLDWDEGPERRRAARAVLPVAAARPLSRRGRSARRRRATPTTATAPPIACARSASAPKRAGRPGSTTARCLTLSAEQIAELEAAATPRAIRFKVPAGTTAFDDAVHGRIEFDGAQHRGLRHPAIGRPSDLSPVRRRRRHRHGDHARRSAATITSRTRRSTCCSSRRSARRCRVFAHVPLILGADKKRLSKRHGATSVMEYQRQGYLPEAMVNFLALLGWSPGDDRELMSRERADRAAFTLEGISGGNAVFNTEKLDWMNGQYIARMSVEQLARRVRDRCFASAGLWPRGTSATRLAASAARAAAAAREAAHRLRRAGAAVPRGYG